MCFSSPYFLKGRGDTVISMPIYTRKLVTAPSFSFFFFFFFHHLLCGGCSFPFETVGNVLASPLGAVEEAPSQVVAKQSLRQRWATVNSNHIILLWWHQATSFLTYACCSFVSCWQRGTNLGPHDSYAWFWLSDFSSWSTRLGTISFLRKIRLLVHYLSTWAQCPTPSNPYFLSQAHSLLSSETNFLATSTFLLLTEWVQLAYDW